MVDVMMIGKFAYLNARDASATHYVVIASAIITRVRRIKILLYILITQQCHFLWSANIFTFKLRLLSKVELS